MDFEKLKQIAGVKTTEELFGFTRQVEDQCALLDDILGSLNKAQKELESSAKQLERAESIEEVSSIASDIGWAVRGVYQGDELESVRHNIKRLREWGQDWKNMAKALFDYLGEEFTLGEMTYLTAQKFRETTYYRLYDIQTKSCLHTGYNTTSPEELIAAYKSYIETDLDEEEEELFNSGSVDAILNYIAGSGFVIETQLGPFPELD